MFLEAGLNRALVEIVISANVPYLLTQNLRFGFLCLIQFSKRSQLNFCGFCKNRFPIWVATQNRFLRPTSFGNNQNGFYRLNPFFGFRKTEPFQKEPNLFETCLFEMNLSFVKRKRTRAVEKPFL